MSLMQNQYSKDENGKEILTDKNNFQVMMEWEKPYMKALIERLNPYGNVLEIGFGMGYSADEIQKYNIRTHTIIEDDKEVLIRLKEWASKQNHKVIIVEGTWQEKMWSMGKYDCIFFDDSPHDDFPDERNVGLCEFYYRIFKYHAKTNTRLVWYCDVPLYWLAHTYTEWSCLPYAIQIPKNCNYVTESSKKSKMVFLPLVKFPYGCMPNVSGLAFDRFLTIIKFENETKVS